MTTDPDLAVRQGGLEVQDRHEVVAELVDISKRFDANYAVRGVSLQLRTGEVLALVGENGAGKSTCVKMLGGVYQPSEGSIRVNGADVELRTPLDAQRLGIAVVHQHPGLFPDLPIYENVYAGQPAEDAVRPARPRPDGPGGPPLARDARAPGRPRRWRPGC